MSQNYIENIYSKEAVRQLFLLKLLYNSPQAIDIETLTFQMAMDRRSIYKTIDQLNTIMEEERLKTEIHVSSRGEYTYTGNKIDYYRLRGLIVEEEPMMQLAKRFLEERSISIVKFCAEYFISESTFKRYVGKANAFLKPLGIRISIKKNEVIVQGAEANVRYCFISLFWRAYHGVSWPFKNINEIHLHHTIDKLLRYSEHISYGKKRQLSYFFAVYILRAQAGFTMNKEELPAYFEPLVYTNPIFERFSVKFSERFPLEKQELGFIYLSLYIFPNSYNYIQESSKTLEVLTTQGYDTYSSIKNFVAFIKEKHPDFDITAPEKKDFVAMLIASRIFIDIFDNVYFNSSALSIFSYAQKNFPHLLPSIQEGIKKFEPALSPYNLKALTLRYAQAYVMEFSPRDFEPQIHILLDTDMPMYTDKIMRERLNAILSPKFNYQWVKREEKVLPDLLLATGMTAAKFSKVPTVYVNAEVSKKDKEAISKACEKIIQEKQNAINK